MYSNISFSADLHLLPCCCGCRLVQPFAADAGLLTRANLYLDMPAAGSTVLGVMPLVQRLMQQHECMGCQHSLNALVVDV